MHVHNCLKNKAHFGCFGFFKPHYDSPQCIFPNIIPKYAIHTNKFFQNVDMVYSC